MASLTNSRVPSSLLIYIMLFSVTLLQAQGAAINRRQTNRIECSTSKSQCQFYSHCIDSQFPCGHDGFIWSYVKDRCQLIDGLEPKLPGRKCSSPNKCVEYNGYQWAHETESCLKTALEEQLGRYIELGLRNDPSVCLQFEQEAIDKMIACYSDAWKKYPLSEADAGILTRLFRIGDYFDAVVDKGIPSLLRRHNYALADELATNKTYDRRLYCVTGSAGYPSHDLTAEETITFVRHALAEQAIPDSIFYYGGKDSIYDGNPCERNQPASINVNEDGFHMVTLFVPHNTVINETTLIAEFIRKELIAASMYELSARADDSRLAVVNYTRCGDGIRHAAEECDYGNGVEGCSLDCRIMANYDCSVDRLQPSVCAMEKCGDGKRTRSEACDDGNSIAGDGCNNCRLEPDTHLCDTSYNATSVCQACPCTEQPKQVQYAPKQLESKALASSRDLKLRTVHLTADSTSSTSAVSASIVSVFTVAVISTTIINLLWR